MIIDGEFREFVGYLAVDDEYSSVSGPKPIGTVFFIHFVDDNGGAVYAVTAQHCLDGLDDFYIQTRGGLDDMKTNVRDWVHSPRTDISACSVKRLPGMTYRLSGDLRSFHRQIHFGQQVFTVGLFSRLPGKRSVEPIVRTGIVASPLTDEAQIELRPITEKGKYTPVIGTLIETRSVSGQSGSPVFVYSEHQRRPIEGLYDVSSSYKSEVRASETDCSLLGLLHGHYEAEAGQVEDGRILDVNAGIALVIPIGEIWEFFMTDNRLIQDRKNAPRRPPSVPKPDSIQQEQTFTKEDFEDALKKVSKRPVECGSV